MNQSGISIHPRAPSRRIHADRDDEDPSRPDYSSLLVFSFFSLETRVGQSKVQFPYTVERRLFVEWQAIYRLAMWPSELARQLNVSPSVISKRLSVYRLEAGLERQDTLDRQTIEHMTEMHLLLIGDATMTVREATLRILGRWIDPVTAHEAHQLTQQVQNLQARLTEMERMLAEVHDIITSHDRRRRDAAEHGQPTREGGARRAEDFQPGGVGQG